MQHSEKLKSVICERALKKTDTKGKSDMKNFTRKSLIFMTAATLALSAGAYAETADITTTSIQENASVNIAEKAFGYGITSTKDIDLTKDMTREEFANYVYNMINSVKELPMAKLMEAPFTDTDTADIENVPKINALSFVQIIEGKGNKTFAPHDKLTKEEAAVILYRCAKYAGAELPMPKVDITYSDNSEISDWAVSQVYGLKLAGIFEDGEAFKPNSNLTSEQGLNAIVNMYEFLKK